MSRLLVTSLLLTSFTVTSFAAETQPPQPALASQPTQPKNLDSLRWLLGSWRRETPKVITFETWTRVSDTTFDGVGGRTDPTSKQVVVDEDLRLVAMGGEIFYIAKVDENAMPTPFKLVRQGPRDLVFENPAHDFPQRLTYKLSADSQTLTVRVEGPGEDGKDRGFDLVFNRVGE